MKMDTFPVTMPPHGLIFGGIEAYHLQEAFGSVPRPPGRQDGAKNKEKRKKNIKNNIAFFYPYFSLKDLPQPANPAHGSQALEAYAHEPWSTYGWLRSTDGWLRSTDRWLRSTD